MSFLTRFMRGNRPLPGQRPRSAKPDGHAARCNRRIARAVMPLVFAVTLGSGLALIPASSIAQSSQFSAAIRVNDKVITPYELNQRIAFIQVLGIQGDPVASARDQLINERLQLQAARAAGIQVAEDALREGMVEFAGRANLSLEQFLAALAAEGVAEESFAAFIRAGVAWRSLVAQQIAGRVSVSEAELERVIAAQTTQGSVQVLLSEIIMTPGLFDDEAAIRARAEDFARITSIEEFSAQARDYSVTDTAPRGGQLPWRNLSEFPAPLRPLLLELSPGEVTQPIDLQGGIALFQLRGLAEGAYRAPNVTALEYAAYALPGGRSPETLAKAQGIVQRIDSCDDLYGVAKGQPAEVLQRVTLPPAQVPTDIALELSKLDADETSLAVTRNGGDTLLLLMLCGRTTGATQDIDRGEMMRTLRNRRISERAEAYLSQLRAEARIIE